MSEHRILVVDDDERVLSVPRRALLAFQNGYEIVTASDGCEALDWVEEVPFDLVITDLKMPGVDGIALTRRSGT